MSRSQKRVGAPMFDRVLLLQKSKLRIEEAAFLLEVTPRSVSRYLNEGKLTYSRTPGGLRRVLSESVMKYL